MRRNGRCWNEMKADQMEMNVNRTLTRKEWTSRKQNERSGFNMWVERTGVIGNRKEKNGNEIINFVNIILKESLLRLQLLLLKTLICFKC